MKFLILLFGFAHCGLCSELSSSEVDVGDYKFELLKSPPKASMPDAIVKWGSERFKNESIKLDHAIKDGDKVVAFGKKRLTELRMFSLFTRIRLKM